MLCQVRISLNKKHDGSINLTPAEGIRHFQILARPASCLIKRHRDPLRCLFTTLKIKPNQRRQVLRVRGHFGGERRDRYGKYCTFDLRSIVAPSARQKLRRQRTLRGEDAVLILVTR